jgi:hypothetical protein
MNRELGGFLFIVIKNVEIGKCQTPTLIIQPTIQGVLTL